MLKSIETESRMVVLGAGRQGDGERFHGDWVSVLQDETSYGDAWE